MRCCSQDTRHLSCPALCRSQKGGFTIFILFIFIVTATILAISIHQVLSSITSAGQKHAENTKAMYLAEAGIHRALWDLRRTFARPLVNPPRPQEGEPQIVDEELLALLDIDRARRWSRHYHLDDQELLQGAEVVVRMEIVDVSANPFSTYLDPLDRVPAALDPHQLKRHVPQERQVGLSPLGGWHGKLRLTSTATYRRTRRVVESWRSIRVLDTTPPGSDYTLFVEGEDREYLRHGRFVLSNLDVPPPVQKEIVALARIVDEVLRTDSGLSEEASYGAVERLNRDMSELLARGDAEAALKTIHSVSSATSDQSIKDTLDRLILSLDPRDWGRVRTNGSLFVKLPFFATDDIINYFVDPAFQRRRRPEVGYLGCDNRLHDPYLSIYTIFEGRIYKMFHRLPPLDQGPAATPQEVPPQRYTINTKMNYPTTRPDTQIPTHLERLREHAENHATIVATDPRSIRSQRDAPFLVAGVSFHHETLHIGGTFTGRGLIISDQDIVITDDIVALSPEDRLGLISLRGAIRFASGKNHYRIDAALTAQRGLQGTTNQTVHVNGNTVVGTLGRESMPRYFSCTFDARHKSQLANNVVCTIARPPLLRRDRGGIN